MMPQRPPPDRRSCWSARSPATLLIWSSIQSVHFGPAAVPSAMQSPSRAASRGDIRVKLHQPSVRARLVSVVCSLGRACIVSIEPLDRGGAAGRGVEGVGRVVVAVADRGLGVCSIIASLGGCLSPSWPQVVGGEPGLDHRLGGAGRGHVRRAGDLPVAGPAGPRRRTRPGEFTETGPSPESARRCRRCGPPRSRAAGRGTVARRRRAGRTRREPAGRRRAGPP